MPTKKEDLPGTLRRSPAKVRRTYAETLDSAHEQYDSEERAHRTAFAAVKHVAEKVGDHWELKDRKGPSDPQAKQHGRRGARRPQGDLRRRRRRGQLQAGPLRARPARGRARPIADDEGRAREGDRPQAGLAVPAAAPDGPRSR